MAKKNNSDISEREKNIFKALDVSNSDQVSAKVLIDRLEQMGILQDDRRIAPVINELNNMSSRSFPSVFKNSVALFVPVSISLNVRFKAI